MNRCVECFFVACVICAVFWVVCTLVAIMESDGMRGLQACFFFIATAALHRVWRELRGTV